MNPSISRRSIITRSPAETRALGARLGKILRDLDVICLEGNLGSGKTTLTQGIARGRGFHGIVSSPTFTLARIYQGPRGRIYHLDLYRINAGETGDIGLEDFLADPKGICVIEWPKSGQAYYPKDRLEISIAPIPKGRRISLRALGTRAREILQAAFANKKQL